jgi:putative Holliday junction resolvase
MSESPGEKNSQPKSELNIPARGRIAGIDFGKTRIGVALSDPDRVLATPWDVYQRRGPQQDAKYFRTLVEREKVVLFVVGLPVHCDGSESESSLAVREFGKWLEETTNIPVVFMDERFSTQTADTWLRAAQLSRKQRQERLDKLSAQIILTAYLATYKPGETPRSWMPSPLDDRQS